jgi:CheY-like chemotaxis protein
MCLPAVAPSVSLGTISFVHRNWLFIAPNASKKERRIFSTLSRGFGKLNPQGEILAIPTVIFVVDDDPSLLKSVGRSLRAHGYEARTFPSAEAFQAVERSEASCLVLDIHLGGTSGIELQRELARSGSSIPVVFITGNDNEATERAAKEAGCIAYLAKPFTTKALMDAVNKALVGA